MQREAGELVFHALGPCARTSHNGQTSLLHDVHDAERVGRGQVCPDGVAEPVATDRRPLPKPLTRLRESRADEIGMLASRPTIHQHDRHEPGPITPVYFCSLSTLLHAGSLTRV